MLCTSFFRNIMNDMLFIKQTITMRGGEDMPGQDGTGPQGNGPESGRGFRKCKYNADPKSDFKKRTGQCQRRQRQGFKQRMEQDETQ